MDRAGSRNTQVEVLNAEDVRVAGIPTEQWATLGILWAEQTSRPADQYARLGIEISQRAVQFRFAWEDGKVLTRAMRLRVGTASYDIRNIDPDDDLKRHVMVMAVEIESDPSRAFDQWRQEMRSGEIVLLRKETFSNGDIDCHVRAKVSGFEASELNAGIDLATRKIIVFAPDITFSEPLSKGDTVIIDFGKASERHLTITEIDVNTHRVAGQTPVIEVTATGP